MITGQIILQYILSSSQPPQDPQIENWSKQNPLLIDKARLFKPVDQARVARVGADIQLTKRILNAIH